MRLKGGRAHVHDPDVDWLGVVAVPGRGGRAGQGPNEALLATAAILWGAWRRAKTPG